VYPHQFYRVEPHYTPAPGATAPAIAQQAGAPVLTAPLTSPDNPLFWFGGLLLVTLGLVGISTQIRLGPLRFTGAAGNS